jgi:activator of HSP90 ATPase
MTAFLGYPCHLVEGLLLIFDIDQNHIEKHSAITGSEAEISNEVGGKIWAYDGYITGENLELVPEKKIVQKWRGSDWPEGHFSKATFKLDKTKNGTKLTFTQTSVPEEFFEDVAHGWYEFYWDPIKEMLEEE